MEQFFKDLKLSDQAINIYNEIFAKSPLTYSELYSIISDLSPEKLNDIIEELINHNLLIKIEPETSEMLLHYVAIPPFASIINYFSYINMDLNKIQTNTLKFIEESLKKKIKEGSNIELNSAFSTFEEIKNDFIEESMIQKQNLEELMEDFEKITKIKTNTSNLMKNLSKMIQKITENTQSQFKIFNENVKKFRNEVIEKIKSLELKKKEIIVIEAFNDIFNLHLQNLFENFASNLKNSIEQELKNETDQLKENLIQPIDKIADEVLNLSNDFKILFLNAVGTIEPNLINIKKNLSVQKDNLESELNNLGNSISEILKNVVSELMIKVSSLNEPIEKILQHLHEKIKINKEIGIEEIWFIRSKFKILEEITNIITKSKNEVILIIPKIENYLNLIQLENLPKSLSIKLISSDPHTNSIVKKIKELDNIKFRNFENEELIALKGDDSQLVICFDKLKTENPLSATIGFGTNNKAMINFLIPLFTTLWSNSKAEEIQPQKSKITAAKIPEKVIIPKKIQADIDSDIISESALEPLEAAKLNKTTTYPKSEDSIGIQINFLFNTLIQNINTLTGQEFSQKLEKIADYVLEKRGFSVTMHKIRSLINKYKDKFTPIINDSERNVVIKELETYKARLL